MAVRVLLALAAFALLYGCGQSSSPVEKQEEQGGAEQAARGGEEQSKLTGAGGVPLWEPYVSAISSLGVGALAGSFATHLWALKREREQQERERDGLLRLVNAEMQFIRSTAEEFLKDPHIMESAQSLAAASPAWEATQVRLAQLISRDEFPKLVKYYQVVAVLRNFLDMLRDAWSRSDRARADVALEAAKAQIGVLESLDKDAHKVLERYIDTSVP